MVCNIIYSMLQNTYKGTAMICIITIPCLSNNFAMIMSKSFYEILNSEILVSFSKTPADLAITWNI